MKTLILIWSLLLPYMAFGQSTSSDAQYTSNGNMLINPSFEQGRKAWVSTAGTVSITKVSGEFSHLNSALKVALSAQAMNVSQTVTTVAGIQKQGFVRVLYKVPAIMADFQVCTLVDAVEQNCVPSDRLVLDNTYRSVEIPLIFGTTSAGIKFKTTSSYTANAFFDSAVLAQGFGNPISTFSNNTGWSDCGLTAGDFQGFGTPTAIQLQCKRDTTDLLVRGRFTSGTPTAVEARMNLKFNGSALTSANSSSIPSIQKTGEYTLGASSPSYGTTTIEASATFSTFSLQSGSQFGINKVNGNVLLGAGVALSLNARIPIAGWEANTNAAIAGCVDAFGCTDTFIATGTTTSGVVDTGSENVDFISGNCTAANPTRCTFTRAFSIAPQCSAQLGNGSPTLYQVTSTTTYVDIYTYRSDTVAANPSTPFKLTCTKTGTDFKPKTAVVSPLQGYVKVPGAENLNVDTFSVSYGNGSATTACTASPCSYLDQIGNAVTSITRSSTGQYSLNLNKTYAKLKCQIAYRPGISWGSQDVVQCTSCATVAFTTVTTAPAVSDSYGVLMCQGSY